MSLPLRTLLSLCDAATQKWCGDVWRDPDDGVWAAIGPPRYGDPGEAHSQATADTAYLLALTPARVRALVRVAQATAAWFANPETPTQAILDALDECRAAGLEL